MPHVCRTKVKRFAQSRAIQARRRLACACIAAFVAQASFAAAPPFDIRQISDNDYISREPVIGSDGLVAWISVPSNNIAIPPAVTLWRNGKLTVLPNSAGMGGSLTPVARGNELAWVGLNTNTAGALSSQQPGEMPGRDAGGDQARTHAVHATNEQSHAYGTNVAERDDATGEVRRYANGNQEIMYMDSSGTVSRVTHDDRNDIGPSLWNGMLAWQKARGWPFGWEIFFWQTNMTHQITTNFYYDMGPKVQGHQVVWYGWDGHDFEIYRYDIPSGKTTQITSNSFDDVAPVVWNGNIVWEGYESPDADIWLYNAANDPGNNPAAAISKISDNPDDDINPRIWNDKVVWQGFDGDDYEIYYYDIAHPRDGPLKLTSNNYDDTNPDILDGTVTWMGYKDNWDSEIYTWNIADGISRGTDTVAQANNIVELTDNDVEDRDPRTAGGRIVWQQDDIGSSRIFLATPTPKPKP